ncbi:MAG: phosphoribosylglycinamide formyltransferase [Anaeromyxobacter sp.]|nr:phosphoribosylglycinamide formyltransferase [Anaeromyxobacter sp.]MBL0276064.1 phosphoribosylglycinamide formyltransferase [Anaeromyxobacter sp.]
MIRLGVLASGSGTNLQALLDACAGRRIDAEVALVLSNVPGAGALARAAAAGVASDCLPSKGVADRAAYDAALVARLAGAGVDLVCLAGYMRLVTPTFLRAFGPSATSRGCPRVVNVHPALLPAFPGLHAQAQALAAGVKLAGCTVHFVDEGTDTGPVIAQAAVPVLDGDDEASLAARILVEEHRLYPAAVGWFAEGRLSLSGRTVRLAGAPAAAAGALRAPALTPA